MAQALYGLHPATNAIRRCLSWVKTGKARCEHMFSALPLKADVAQRGRHVRFVPPADARWLAVERPKSAPISLITLLRQRPTAGPISKILDALGCANAWRAARRRL